ncbi:hypothetical protein LTS18_013680, partial [Coniosporium uncinatum]
MARRIFLLLAVCLATVLLLSFLLFGDSIGSRPLLPRPFFSGKTGTSTSAEGAPLLQDEDVNEKEYELGTHTRLAGLPIETASNPPPSPSRAARPRPPLPPVVLGPTATDGATHIAITESGGSHDEVSAALIHAFGKQENAQLQTYLLLQRYGIKEIIADFNLTNKIPPSKSFEQFKSDITQQVPNILVMTTCELDSKKMPREMDALLARGETYLFCFIHHAERWSTKVYKNILKPWVEKEMVQFVSLSPHTAHFLEMNSLSQWDLGTQPKVKALTPVFPVKISPSNSSRRYEDLDFALQGNYDPSRRDYSTIFEHLGNFLQQDREEGVGPRSSSPSLYSPTVSADTDATDAADAEEEGTADDETADANGSGSNDTDDATRADLMLHLL